MKNIANALTIIFFTTVAVFAIGSLVMHQPKVSYAELPPEAAAAAKVSLSEEIEDKINAAREDAEYEAAKRKERLRQKSWEREQQRPEAIAEREKREQDLRDYMCRGLKPSDGGYEALGCTGGRGMRQELFDAIERDRTDNKN